MDLLNPNAKYELLADSVPRVSGATGGLLQSTPIVYCRTSQECVVFGKPEIEKLSSLPPQTIGEFWRRPPVAPQTLGTLFAKSSYLAFGLRKSTISWPNIETMRYFPKKEMSIMYFQWIY